VVCDKPISRSTSPAGPDHQPAGAGAAGNRLGVAPSQGPAGLATWGSGGVGGDPPTRVRGGRQRWVWCRGHQRLRDKAARVQVGRTAGQQRPDSAPRIARAMMPVSARLRVTGGSGRRSGTGWRLALPVGGMVGVCGRLVGSEAGRKLRTRWSSGTRPTTELLVPQVRQSLQRSHTLP
jgi:hypothetical protein